MRTQVNPHLITLTKKVLKNALIASKIDKLNNAINNWDIPSCTALLEEITNLNIIVDQTLRVKAEERIEEAKKNPALMVDKQKEMQKLAGKGKKK